ncbi:Signal transduction histidine kinase [Butyrivibrio fibrisolvens]|uniref:histidine kinase n=1 Tax=Butyrivibrio fibrisolvens TaxID=831 RepID=A0A1H9RD42_BUTFI|nr:HAMP domain-containing sensor histidine kinase [Butyrivibrio fibrisolvens]SER70455.1 Signal transduction histidine kinase [Butyrivibrio fibrisolvens]
MNNIIIAAAVALIIVSVITIVVDRKKTDRTLNNIEKMLDEAIKGEFSTEHFDESRMSRLESKLHRFLDSSSISAQNVKSERDNIKELISDISHQTKTPIANLILYSELLGDADIPEEQKGNAAAILEQAEKLRFLIDNLVKMSRLENGILSLSPEKSDISSVLNDICSQYRDKAETKGLELSLSAKETSAIIDRKWTAEAIGNIVDNAIKYTSEGSVTITASDYEMFVRVDISDTGMGISEEEQAKIFQRFYRSNNVRDKEGVGIGLYLARQIITGEGGYIKVSSKVGEGTTFSVFLPKD